MQKYVIKAGDFDSDKSYISGDAKCVVFKNSCFNFPKTNLLTKIEIHIIESKNGKCEDFVLIQSNVQRFVFIVRGTLHLLHNNALIILTWIGKICAE